MTATINNRKTALITGVTGQVGRYLSDLLLEKGYDVHGVVRRVSYPPAEEIDKRIHIHNGDMTDSGSLARILIEVSPNEIYNLAAMSDVHESFTVPEYTGDVNGLGVTRILEMAKLHLSDTKIYQASTSEMFGTSPPPQDENTPFAPTSPYAISKIYAYHMARHYRAAYGMYAANGILFNHESPLRGMQFVTRKITRGLSRISLGIDKCLQLGNLNAQRDWGHAKDYARAQWLIMQHASPSDFVISTGKTHTVRHFAELVANNLGMQLIWHGEGVSEVGIDYHTGRSIIRVDPNLFRPIDIGHLCGNSKKAKHHLGWEPHVTFEELVSEMTAHDLAEARQTL